MLRLLLSTGLLFGSPLTGPPRLVAPAAACHASIDARCSSLRGEEALRCHNEADAQCDISDAEQFTADGDVTDTVARIDRAQAKYEALLNMMLADADPGPIAETMVRYAAGSANIFTVLAREGEVEDLTRAVRRLERVRGFAVSLVERRGDLAARPDLVAALADLTQRLATALDQLARQEIRRAARRQKTARGLDASDGGAHSYYEDAIRHSAAAYALVPNFAYRVVRFDAELAQAELSAVLARGNRTASSAACARYRELRRSLGEVERASPQRWKEHPKLHDFQRRAEQGARGCAARPRIVAGGVLLGVGAAGLGAALGLFAGYDRACAYSEATGSCSGIVAGSPEVDRYTAQIRASVGLAAVGGALFTAGAAVLIHGLVQRERAQPRRFSLAPTFGPRHTGVALGLRF